MPNPPSSEPFELSPSAGRPGPDKPYVVHTDGARKGSGAGGWGALIECPAGSIQEVFGGELDTTNNRMEMMAALKGLQVTPIGATVTLTTDSQYVQKGISEWLPGWKRRNWRTASGEAVKNQDLWELLDVEARGRQVTWKWVRGHNGHPENERADELANLGVETVAKGATSAPPRPRSRPSWRPRPKEKTRA